jgi:hypothetical protein
MRVRSVAVQRIQGVAVRACGCGLFVCLPNTSGAKIVGYWWWVGSGWHLLLLGLARVDQREMEKGPPGCARVDDLGPRYPFEGNSYYVFTANTIWWLQGHLH